MNEVQRLAEDANLSVIYIEAYDEIRLADALVRALRPGLLKMSRRTAAQHHALRALSGLRNFASSFQVSFQDVEIGISAEEGLADTGDITADLPDLFLAVGEAARAGGHGLSIIIDEVQYLSEPDMASLIMAMHRCNQRALPVVLFGAGLPQLRAKMGHAKSYVERLFDFPGIDALPVADARIAVERPANDEGVEYERDALDEILRVTSCNPTSFRSGDISLG